MGLKYANNAKTTLNGAHNSSTTTITVVDGSVFPTLGAGDYFYMTLEDVSLNNEIVKVTARSTNTLTVVRAQNGTTAKSFSTADKAEGRMVTGILDDLFDMSANMKAWLADPTSAKLLAAMVDKTGTGSLVFATSPTFVTPLLGTPTSGVLTNCTGLPISGLVSSTSTDLGVGSLNIGHASDTTLARIAAGRVSIEGNEIATISQAKTWTAAQRFDANPTFNAASQPVGAFYAIGASNRAFWGLATSNNPVLLTYNDSGTFVGTAIDVDRLTRVTNFAVTPTVAADPIMTRGASETITGLKTFYTAPYVTINNGTYEKLFITNSSSAATLRCIGAGGGSADFGAHQSAADTAIIRTGSTTRVEIDGTSMRYTGRMEAAGSGSGANAAFRATGSYGGGFAMNDGAYAGMYAQSSGVDLILYSNNGSNLATLNASGLTVTRLGAGGTAAYPAEVYTGNGRVQFRTISTTHNWINSGNNANNAYFPLYIDGSTLGLNINSGGAVSIGGVLTLVPISSACAIVSSASNSATRIGAGTTSDSGANILLGGPSWTFAGLGALYSGSTQVFVWTATVANFVIQPTFNNKALFAHAGSYTSGQVTYSTSTPSGGSDGDIWFQYV